MPIDIGIAEKDRQKIAEGLKVLLASSYTLYLKTHNFHWNVTGPMFNALHTMFEGQYTELAAAIDEIAERIRALGVFAPGSFSQYKELSAVKEETGVPSAVEMIAQLAKDNETLSKVAREVLPAAGKADDEPTNDLLTQRMQTHEKAAWMLRSMLS
ncbi:MAG: Dps family protein [Rhodospirillaceae bacterium]